MLDIKRRQFLTLLGGAAAAWPVGVRAQQSSPVVGYLAHGTPEGGAALVAAVRKGLGEAGLAEGKDFTSQFRWASNNADRLPGLAIDLIQRRVAVIITLGTVAPHAPRRRRRRRYRSSSQSAPIRCKRVS
jgi:putative tryptophan/tyrosine transport system substrate-binding protein